jgi:hypothetical protein
MANPRNNRNPAEAESMLWTVFILLYNLIIGRRAAV